MGPCHTYTRVSNILLEGIIQRAACECNEADKGKGKGKGKGFGCVFSFSLSSPGGHVGTFGSASLSPCC